MTQNYAELKKENTWRKGHITRLKYAIKVCLGHFKKRPYCDEQHPHHEDGCWLEELLRKKMKRRSVK